MNDDADYFVTIEQYATTIVCDYAEGGVEDDIDEDGELASGEEHDAATDLALKIIRGMRAHQDKVLEFAALANDEPEDDEPVIEPTPGAPIDPVAQAFVAGLTGRTLSGGPVSQ